MKVNTAELDKLNNDVRQYDGLRERIILPETQYKLSSLLRFINHQHLAVKAYLEFKEKELEELKLQYATPESRTFTDTELGYTDTFSLEETLFIPQEELYSDTDYFTENLYTSLLCLVLETYEKIVYQLCEFGSELQGNTTVFSQLNEQVATVQNFRLYLNKNSEHKTAKSAHHHDQQAAYNNFKEIFFEQLDPSLKEHITCMFDLLLDRLNEVDLKLDHTLVIEAYEIVCHLIETIESAFEKKFYPEN